MIIFFLIWINFYSLIYLKIIFFWQHVFISLISSQSRRFLIKNNTASSEGSPLNNTLYTILEDSSLRPWITLADEIISSSRTISCALLTNQWCFDKAEYSACFNLSRSFQFKLLANKFNLRFFKVFFLSDPLINVTWSLHQCLHFISSYFSNN